MANIGFPVLLAPKCSIGIRTYSENLAYAFRKQGCGAILLEKPRSSDNYIHFQLGNSTRRLWKYMVRSPKPSLVTLHDVIPRHKIFRRIFGPLQARLLDPHFVVVHSNHSLEMLRSYGFKGKAIVIRHGANEERLPDSEIAVVRRSLSVAGEKILVIAGILKKGKYIDSILTAAQQFPRLKFLFIGRIADAQTRKFFSQAGSNVIHVNQPNDENFKRYISAADILLNFRTESVGEVSGPVVLSHGLGVPVAGYECGFMPEYCGKEDMLFSPKTPLVEAFKMVEECLDNRRTIPKGSPQITTWNRSAEKHIDMYKELGFME